MSWVTIPSVRNNLIPCHNMILFSASVLLALVRGKGGGCFPETKNVLADRTIVSTNALEWGFHGSSRVDRSPGSAKADRLCACVCWSDDRQLLANRSKILRQRIFALRKTTATVVCKRSSSALVLKQVFLVLWDPYISQGSLFCHTGNMRCYPFWDSDLQFFFAHFLRFTGLCDFFAARFMPQKCESAGTASFCGEQNILVENCKTWLC